MLIDLAMRSLMFRWSSRSNLIVGLAMMAFLTTFGQEWEAIASEPPRPIPVAILSFENRGEAKEEAASLPDLLFVKLIASDKIALVERQAMKSVLEELKLSKSGVVKAEEANQVGQLTGAKLLICGSVLRIQGKILLIAKVIGTETSRLTGASVQGHANASLDELAGKLAEELEDVIAAKGESLLPKSLPVDEWLASTKKLLAKRKLPSVTVKIVERHVNQATFDPAAQTECERLLSEIGFTVIDSGSSQAEGAEYRIQGEALSQFAANHADLISVRCRVEAKIVSQQSGNVMASEAETVMAVDLAEQIAAKTGFQEAARKIIDRFLLKFASQP